MNPVMIIDREGLKEKAEKQWLDVISVAIFRIGMASTTREIIDNVFVLDDLGENSSRQEKYRKILLLKKAGLAKKLSKGKFMFNPDVIVYMPSAIGDSDDDRIYYQESLVTKWNELV